MPEDAWIRCPKCRTLMMPLRNFDPKEAGSDPATRHIEWWEIALFGFWIFFVNKVAEVFSSKHRENSVAEQKDEVLAEFPASQICPECLHITKRVK